MQRSRALPCLAVIIGVAVAGCGGSDKKPPADRTSAAPISVDQRSILATIDALQTASRRGDGHTVCDDPSWIGDLYDYGHGQPAVTEAETAVDGPWLRVELPPSTRVRLTLRLDPHARPPSYRTPFD